MTGETSAPRTAHAGRGPGYPTCMSTGDPRQTPEPPEPPEADTRHAGQDDHDRSYDEEVGRAESEGGMTGPGAPEQ